MALPQEVLATIKSLIPRWLQRDVVSEEAPADGEALLWDADHAKWRPGAPAGGVTGTGTPALTLSTTNSAGSAATAVATDATIAAFDATTPADIAGAAATGSAGKMPRRDHVHRGVLSVNKNGDTTLYGAVTLSGGTGITLTQTAQDISIAFSGTVSNALLDGSNHTDTVAQTVSRGSLIYGNSTPKWDELVIGAANRVLWSDGTDVSWSAAPRLANIADTGGTNVITTATSNPRVTVPTLGLTDTTGSGGINWITITSPAVTATALGTWIGLNYGAAVTATVNSVQSKGVSGTATTVSATAGLTGLVAMGLDFTALGQVINVASTFTNIYGVTALGKAIAASASGALTATNVIGGDFTAALQTTNAAASLTITVLAGIYVHTPTKTGTGTFTVAANYGIYVADAKFTTATISMGLKVEDCTVGTTKKVFEFGTTGGGANSGVFYMAGAFAAAANQTPLWISEGATPTVRQLKTMDPGAGGANFAGGELVCILV